MMYFDVAVGGSGQYFLTRSDGKHRPSLVGKKTLVLADDVAELEAERDRYKAALEKIAKDHLDMVYTDAYKDKLRPKTPKEIAQEALTGGNDEAKI
jgi:hypothetical protein